VNDFFKYHGLGNDYLVLEPERFVAAPSPDAIRLICDRHRGVGSDGILWGPLDSLPNLTVPRGTCALRIFNPDGSEAEKSGNGLRIFARHLWLRRIVTQRAFALFTPAGAVDARILDDAGSSVAIGMGRVRFGSGSIPMTGPEREVLRETLRADGQSWTVCAANIGNPHCVVLLDDPTPELARRIGPHIETHPSFPNRTNVQLLVRLDAHHIRIEIWERGAGYTQASGSSSCAAAAVACRLGFCESPVTVQMPGGTLSVELDTDFHATLTGPVAAVSQGDFHPELLAAAGLRRR
jgi:diaminopimelate epimerase